MKSIKNIFYVLLVFIFPVCLFSQEYFYYYNGEKQYLQLDTNRVFVSIVNKETFRASSFINNNRLVFHKERMSDILKIKQNINSDFFWLYLDLSEIMGKTYLDKIAKIKQIDGAQVVCPSFKGSKGEKVGMSNFFYVKLKQLSDTILLSQYSSANKVIIVKQDRFMPLWFVLSCTKNTKGNAMEMANQYYESKLFQYAIPDLMVDFTLNCVTNDPYFSDQWGLDNLGQYGENVGIDINACSAWGISNGEGVTVAVIDNGIEIEHPDLQSNIHTLSYDTETATSPSIVRGPHGVACAGIIGAVGNNSIGIKGVAPKTKLMSVSNSLMPEPLSAMSRGDGINWAVAKGADVINNSWRSDIRYPNIDDAIQNAINNGRNGKGCIVVFAAGNNNTEVNYPADSHPEILAVGAMSPCGERKNPNSCDGEMWGSSYGNELDVIAPGVLIYTTDLQGSAGYASTDYISHFSGTSAAAPHVAGVAALILSVNPDLTGRQVRDIIEQTARKIRTDLYLYSMEPNRTNGTWNTQVGYGLVDAYAAVLMAESLNPKIDLHVRDSISDIGDEPSNVARMWASPDIWIEDLEGNIVAHPRSYTEYNLCVRVHNRSDRPSTGTERLFTNWAKASPSLSWPDSWFLPNHFLCDSSNIGIPKGGIIGDANGTIIPVIQPNNNTVVRVKWRTPIAKNYAKCTDLANDLWHFCLLARVHDSYPIAGEDFDAILGDFVVDNNNVAWKNVTFIEGENNSGVIGIYNPFKEPNKFSLIYSLRKNGASEYLHKYADVYLTLSRDFVRLLDAGEVFVKGLKRAGDNTFLVVDPEARFDNIRLDPFKLYTLQVTVKFFTKEVPEDNAFVFDIMQYCEDRLIGGETYMAVRDPYRDNYFSAKATATDTAVLATTPITFTAEDINENATYTWYNEQGDTVAIGTSLTTTPTQSQRYKLEVVADSDGFKDVGSIDVLVRNGFITAISPNPAVDDITVSYLLSNTTTNATIRISDIQQLVTVSYPIVATETSKTVSVGNFALGSYIVQLVVDGVVVDSKQLIIY